MLVPKFMVYFLRIWNIVRGHIALLLQALSHISDSIFREPLIHKIDNICEDTFCQLVGIDYHPLVIVGATSVFQKIVDPL